MSYAIVENGLVTNIISLSPSNASDFPDAVDMGGRSVCIGDTYTNGKFYRDGEEILTPMEQEIKTLRTELAAAKILLGVD